MVERPSSTTSVEAAHDAHERELFSYAVRLTRDREVAAEHFGDQIDRTAVLAAIGRVAEE